MKSGEKTGNTVFAFIVSMGVGELLAYALMLLLGVPLIDSLHGPLAQMDLQRQSLIVLAVTLFVTVVGRLLHWLIGSIHAATLLLAALGGLFIIFVDTLIVPLDAGRSDSAAYTLALVFFVFAGMTAATVYGQEHAWQKLRPA